MRARTQLSALSLTALLCAGCGTEAPGAEPPSAAGTGGAAGAAAAPAAGSGGSAGAAGSGGSAGGASIGGAGTGGVAGGSAEGGSGGGGGQSVDDGPVECQPGTEGNGTAHQDGPYGAPAESQGQLQFGEMTGQSTYDSEIYGYRFTYNVYVPDKYDAATPAALMVFQDGIAHYINDIGAHLVMDKLIERGDIPIMIGLFVNPTGQRSAEYNTPDDKYARFLVEEIIPDVITSRYNIVQDRDGWATAGFSSGGIAAITIGWNKPDVFSRLLTHNASLPLADSRGVDYIELASTGPKLDLRIMLMSNPNDIRGNEPGGWFAQNGEFAEALAAKGYDYRYITGQASAGHYPPVHPRADLPQALRWLWQGCSISP